MVMDKNAEFIVCGGYGAVFKPGKTKKGREIIHIPNTITKVYFNIVEWFREIIRIDIVKRIDPSHDFTPKKYLDEIIKPSEHFTKDDYNKCDKKWNWCETNYQIIFEDCGIDLYNRDIESLTSEIFLINMIAIFKGLIKLKNNNLVHQDIKPANLIYNPKTNVIKLVDFGLLSSTKYIYNPENNYTHYNYIYFPPEYNIFNMICKNEKIDKRLYDILMENNYLFFMHKYKYNFNNTFLYYEQQNSWREFNCYIKYIIKNNFDLEYFHSIADKVDVYMLGLAILEILFRNKHLKIPGLIHLIQQMIRLDPEDRITIEDATIEFEKIKNDYIKTKEDNNKT
jgi:serine/threonine protein kinase